MNFFGVPYPITKNPRGFLHTQSGIDQIKSDLLVLLLSNPGERCMLTDYGTGLRNLLFDPNDTIVADAATALISKAIATYEPRVIIQSIDVGYVVNDGDFNQSDITSEDSQHILGIKIMFFDPENISELQALTLEVPLQV